MPEEAQERAPRIGDRVEYEWRSGLGDEARTETRKGVITDRDPLGDGSQRYKIHGAGGWVPAARIVRIVK